MLTVRSNTPHDADATIDIFLRAIRDVASKDYNPAQIDAWAQVENHEGWARRRASRPTWVAIVDGISAGFSDLEPSGYLDMMFVHPHYQGMGVASLLLRTVEMAADDQALPFITTEASLTARPFFERRGFEVVAPPRGSETWPGVEELSDGEAARVSLLLTFPGGGLGPAATAAGDPKQK